MTQEDFGLLAGVTRKTQRLYESGDRAPDAVYLAAVAAAGVDVLYVLTGQRSNQQTPADMTKSEAREHEVTSQSNPPLTAGLAGTTNPVTNADGAADIDEALMRRIVTMLAKTAKAAGRRWESERLMLAAVDVYKFLAKEEKVDDAKLERVLKLVVNR